MIIRATKNCTQMLLGSLNRGHERSVTAKKNIVASFLIRGVGIIVSLMLVPITINYVDPTQFGVWVTLSSIVLWMNFFDIGLGHGLRNRFAQAIASGDKVTARRYVSTTYAIVCVIACMMFMVFCTVNPFLNWPVILNTQSSMRSELTTLALLVFGMFSLQFVLRIISTILLACQETAKAHLLPTLGNILSLATVFVMSKTTEGSLIKMCLALNGGQLVVFLVASAYCFGGRYRAYAPAPKYVELQYVQSLATLGLKFFVIQICGVLLYQTGNIVIVQLFGPQEVTTYYVTFRYFGIITMVFGIAISPFWSAITEAHAKGDYIWIERVVKKLRFFVICLAVLSTIMLLVSKYAFQLWLGNSVAVPFRLSLFFSINVTILAWNGVFSQFLNGVGKIKIQLICGITGALLNVPLAIILGRQMGVQGVVLACVATNLLGVVIYPVQYNKIMSKSDYGIWGS